MDRLVWQSAKAQLYLVEAVSVKEQIGRDKIRRNKDALRELHCLQEILADLHAGQFGRESARRSAADAAARCWASLQELAAQLDQATEDLCEVPQALRSFFLARPSHRSAQAGCLSEAASSTRAPSTGATSWAEFADLDTLGRSAEGGAIGDGARVRGSRLTDLQLDALAAELREELDQEHTALLASIDEVHGLIEAEVAGVSSLPSRMELEAFTARADQILQELRQREESRAAGDERRRQGQLEPLREAAEERGDEAQCRPARARWADLEVESGSEEDARGGDQGLSRASRKAHAPCSQCGGLFPHTAFSRREWRKARGLGGRSAPGNATCRTCSGTDARPPMSTRHAESGWSGR